MFYRKLIDFSYDALKPAFEKVDQIKLADEISRLYRSNAFNCVSRDAFET
jgi:hypothetical protein